MQKPKFSILVPVYNAEKTIKDALVSILRQSYKNFEIIVQDNSSSDSTASIVKSIKSKKIKYFKNKTNLGYSINLIKAKKNCRGKIIFLMASDDVLERDALLRTLQAFNSNPDIGAVTRPYYWFHKNLKQPVRVKEAQNWKKDTVLCITDEDKKIFSVLSTLDQLSGLAFKRSLMRLEFSKKPWIAHGYPFLAILKKHPIVFLRNVTVAVRIHDNATRTNIFQDSPMENWKEFIETVLHEPRFDSLKKRVIKNFIAINYVGLVQIKNYGSYKALLREIILLVKYRKANLLSPVFWFFALLTLITPAFLLKIVTDWYKDAVNLKIIPKAKYKKLKFEV